MPEHTSPQLPVVRLDPEMLQQAVHLYDPVFEDGRIVDLIIVYLNRAAMSVPLAADITVGALATHVFVEPGRALDAAEIAWKGGTPAPYTITRAGHLDHAAVLVHYDVTTAREGDHILQISNDRTLEYRLDAFEAAAAARTATLERVSHDLRNPLNAVVNYLHLLRLIPAGSEKAAGVLHHASVSADLMVDLVGDLADLATLHDDRVRPREPIALATVLERVAIVAGPIAEVRGVTLVIEPGIAVQVHTDALRLFELIENLVSNGIRHTPSGGTVQVTVRETPEELRIAITDAGPGVPPERLAPLFRDDAPMGTAPGASRGLSIVRSIARRLGAHITVVNPANDESAIDTSGIGAVFTIHLPR
ncbi:MAG: hypothetical protein F2681_03790 [Actinobacteria bacterium]|uniref:histidine kinase n=1 Tax=freshwater metagenome TaxID=449393 RepID=A0A6J6QKM8_9ZZZZ|nr:hypothetical protein [Actinomycetota bacterium]MSW76797.1 hypothetical protein [Actinomycetota bacterium]MSX54756.1 hypothetical protein [Actinomycetota bacterium]MSX92724.1 hypothetical protein [Actinomycetota bacterium]MSZ82244.1 hypothetical protein [Actinomycetota bacterium]